MEFNSSGFSGSVTKTVRVESNDPAKTNVTLLFRAAVWKAIDVLPARVVFSLPPDAQSAQQKKIRILNNLDVPVILSEVTLTNASFETSFKPLKEGKEYELEVTVKPPLGLRNVSSAIHIKTSSEKVPRLSIPLHAIVQPAVSSTPGMIWVPPGPLTNEARQTVILRNNASSPLKLSEPSIAAEGVRFEITETKPGQEFTLTAVFPPNFVLRRASEIRLKSSLSISPEVAIPVFQKAQPRVASVPRSVPTQQN